jgi:hypothetical protein
VGVGVDVGVDVGVGVDVAVGVGVVVDVGVGVNVGVGVGVGSTKIPTSTTPGRMFSTVISSRGNTTGATLWVPTSSPVKSRTTLIS